MLSDEEKLTILRQCPELIGYCQLQLVNLVEEAAKRGLDCEKSCPKIFERYLDPASIKMFEDMGVMKKNELEARNEVKWETYTKKIQIEARVMGDLSMNHIIPVATHYQSQLAKNVENMIDIFGDEEGHLNNHYRRNG